MQETLDRKPLDRALVARIVRYVCFAPMADLPASGHVMKLATDRFGASDEFFAAVDIVVRNLRELVRLDEIDANLEARAMRPEPHPANLRHVPKARRTKKPAASLPLFDFNQQGD